MKTRQTVQMHTISYGRGIQLPWRGSVFNLFLNLYKEASYEVLFYFASVFFLIVGLTSPNFQPPSIGGIAFGLGGCLAVRKANGDWYIALLAGISTYSWGGGIIRDIFFLGGKPWFLDQLAQVSVVVAVLLFFIPVYDNTRKNAKKYGCLLNVAGCILFACDILGLIEFAQGGQAIALERGAGLQLVLVCGLATQLGGGLLAAIFRYRFIALKDTICGNKHYYLLATLISGLCLIARLSGADVQYTFAVMLIPSIAAGFLIDSDQRKKAYGVLCSFAKGVILYACADEYGNMQTIVRNSFVNFNFKQSLIVIDSLIKLRLAYIKRQYCQNCYFHRKQGLMA